VKTLKKAKNPRINVATAAQVNHLAKQERLGQKVVNVKG